MPVGVRDRFTFRIRAKHLNPLLMLRVVRVVRALVVVGLPRFDPRRRVVRALGVVQRRVLREVVEVVRRGRCEHGGRAAEITVCRLAVRIRQEAHAAVGVDIGRIGEILLHLLIGIRHLRQCAFFEVDLVEQAHRVRAVDFRRHLAVFVHRGRVQAQRQQFGGDIDGDEIAGLALIVRDDDLHRAQIGFLVDLVRLDLAFERVGGLRTVRRGLRRDRLVLLPREHDAVHAGHAHVVAKLVGEGHHTVAGGRAALRFSLDRRIRVARDLAPNRVEHGVQRVGVGRGQIIVRVRGLRAQLRVRRGIRVVARDTLHERVRPERHVAIACHLGHVGGRIGAGEDADRIDGSAVGLHGFCLGNGGIRHLVFEGIAARRLAISEEDDDLRSVGTRVVEHLVGVLQTIIRARGASGGKVADRALQCFQAIGQATACIRCARIGDQTDAVLLVRIAHLGVRGNRLVDEAIDRLLERIHTRGRGLGIELHMVRGRVIRCGLWRDRGPIQHPSVSPGVRAVTPGHLTVTVAIGDVIRFPLIKLIGVYRTVRGHVFVHRP